MMTWLFQSKETKSKNTHSITFGKDVFLYIEHQRYLPMLATQQNKHRDKRTETNNEVVRRHISGAQTSIDS